MQKLWALLFGVVLLACFVLTAAALMVPGLNWGLPQNIAEKFGGPVDDLFYLILGFVGFFYVLTEVILVVALYRFVGNPARRATYTHGNHKLEMAWTIVPAAILLFIAYQQIHTWEEIKYQSHFPNPDQVVQVTARQWEWRMRYSAEEVPGTETLKLTPTNQADWGETEDFSDVHVANNLYTWKAAKVKILLRTKDIIHSFFLPNLRLKQDALPGKTIPMWFEPNDFNAKFDDATKKITFPDDKKHWEIACAELCGGGHYRMRGKLVVFETKDEFDKWLKYTKSQQNSREPEKRVAATEE